jgi:hypothetical protein
MKKIIYYIFALIAFLSCSKSNHFELDKFPVFQPNMKIGKAEPFEFNFDGFHLINNLGKLLAKELETKCDLFGIARFKLSEQDSVDRRKFDLILIQSRCDNDTINYLVCLSKKEKSVVSNFPFDHEKLIIRSIYPHSSKLSHNGIAIEFIEDKSTQDSVKLIGHYVELFEKGNFEYISRIDVFPETLDRLSKNCNFCGDFISEEYPDQVQLKIREPNKNNKDEITFSLRLDGPKSGVIRIFEYSHEPIINNKIKVDSLLFINFDDDNIVVEMNNYKLDEEEFITFKHKMIK